MQGNIEVKISNAKIKYEFTLHRNITVLMDEGATGKTSLVRMISNYLPGGGTGISIWVSTGVEITVLTRATWNVIVDTDMIHSKNVKPNIFIVDESMPFLTSGDFADFVWNSGCYFILITRGCKKTLKKKSCNSTKRGWIAAFFVI